jgi:hypothetical protein
MATTSLSLNQHSDERQTKQQLAIEVSIAIKTYYYYYNHCLILRNIDVYLIIQYQKQSFFQLLINDLLDKLKIININALNMHFQSNGIIHMKWSI